MSGSAYAGRPRRGMLCGVTEWRSGLRDDAVTDVAALDRALGIRLRDRDYVDALLDPRGHLFQRLEYVGDAILDAVVLQALVALQPWTERSLSFVSDEQQSLVSDHALGKVAARRGLPDVRAFPVSVHRLGDRIEAAIGAAWADAGLSEAEALADRLVLRPGLHGRVVSVRVPEFGGDRAYEAAASVCGHDPIEPAWYGAAASGGAPRRRLAVIGNAVLEAAYSTAQYVDDELATEAEMSEERRSGTSNAALAERSHSLGLARHHDDEQDRRAMADEVQALVGAVTMDAGTITGLSVSAAVLGRRFAPGPVAFPS